MHDAMNCPVCRAQRDLEIELVRDDRLNAVAQEWKNDAPLVRVGQGYYTTDYDPKPEPLNFIDKLTVACIVAVGAALAAVAWAGGM